jgi:hypothetical protein
MTAQVTPFVICVYVKSFCFSVDPFSAPIDGPAAAPNERSSEGNGTDTGMHRTANIESSTSSFDVNGSSNDALGSSSTSGIANSSHSNSSRSGYTTVGTAGDAIAAMNAAQRAAPMPAENAFADSFSGDHHNEFGGDETIFNSPAHGSADPVREETRGGTGEEPENEVYEREGDEDDDDDGEEEGDVPLSTRELFGQLQQWFQSPGGGGNGAGGMPPELEDPGQLHDDFDPRRNPAVSPAGGGLRVHAADGPESVPFGGFDNGGYSRQHSHSWHHDGSSDGDAAGGGGGGGVNHNGVLSSGERNTTTTAAAATAGAARAAPAAATEPIAAASAAAAAAALAAEEAGAVTEAVADDLLAQFMEWVAGPRVPGSPPPPLETLRSQASSSSGDDTSRGPAVAAGPEAGDGNRGGPGSHRSSESQHSDEVWWIEPTRLSTTTNSRLLYVPDFSPD